MSNLLYILFYFDLFVVQPKAVSAYISLVFRCRMRLSKIKGDELMKRSLTLVLVMVLILSLALTACGPKAPAEPTPGEPVAEPKVLRMAQTTEPPNLDPQTSTDTVSFEVLNGIYEGLVRVVNGEVKPGIAENWDISEDGLTYTFHLRDAKWSDGKPVTAHDFEFAVKRLLDPALASEYSFQGYYLVNGEEFNTGAITDASQVGVKALDDKTIEFKLVAPTKYFLALMGFGSFMPTREDVYNAHGTAYAAEADKAVYNGPFVLTEWKHEESLTLEKNPEYWNTEAIKLDKVEMPIIKDSKTAVGMYEVGDLDYVGLSKDFVGKYKDAGDAKFYYDGALFYFQFNVKGSTPEMGKFLSNANFRKAFGYAIDRKQYIDAVMKNDSDPATRYALPQLAGNEKLYVEEYPFDFYPASADPAKAKEYLDKALKELNTTADKIPAIQYLTDDTEDVRIMAEAIQEMVIKNLGIKFEIKQVPFKQRIDLMNKKDYDLVFAGWGPDYDDPMTYLDLWVIGGGHNNTNWEDQTYTDLIKFAKSTADMKARGEKMFEAEKRLLEEGPIVPVYIRRRAYAEQPYVKNLVKNFVGATRDFVYTDIVK